MTKYQISWVALFPLKGKATKRDNKAISRKLNYNSLSYLSNTGVCLLGHGPSKEKLKEKIDSIIGCLNKEYRVYFFSDAQFGANIQANEINLTLYPNGGGVKLTKTQLQNSFIIK